MSNSINNSSLASDSPASAVSSIETDSPPRPRYPPGIGQILKTNNKSERQSTHDGHERGSGPAHDQAVASSSCDSNQTGSQTPRSKSNRGLNTQELALMAELSELARVKDLPYTPQEKAIRIMQSASQSLGQIRDDMYATIREYFSSKIMINCLEVPAYRHLRKALNRLIATLNTFATTVNRQCYHTNETDVKFMTYQIKEVLDHVLGEGEGLLKLWNHREGGQTVGQPLTGKNWRMRRILVHDSNERIENITKMAIIAEARIRREQALRQPLVEAKVERGKGLGWLKYIGIVGEGFGIHGGPNRGQGQSEEDRFGWRLRE